MHSSNLSWSAHIDNMCQGPETVGPAVSPFPGGLCPLKGEKKALTCIRLFSEMSDHGAHVAWYVAEQSLSLYSLQKCLTALEKMVAETSLS